jgi:hypothetical protein
VPMLFVVFVQTLHRFIAFRTPAIIYTLSSAQPIPVATKSIVWVCGCLLAGTGCLNPARDRYLLWVLCVARPRYQQLVDPSSRGGLLSKGVCIVEYDSV